MSDSVGGARAWCSPTGTAGCRRGRTGSANLADHVGDDPDAVARNRELAATRAGVAAPDEWVGVHQVHGNDVVCVDAPLGAVPDADASVTTTVGCRW